MSEPIVCNRSRESFDGYENVKPSSLCSDCGQTVGEHKSANQIASETTKRMGSDKPGNAHWYTR